MDKIRGEDPEIYRELMKEVERQRFVLNMIPSENYASPAVLQACGSVLNNKYRVILIFDNKRIPQMGKLQLN